MIEAGHVLKQFVNDTNPPKVKIYIIIARSSDFGKYATIFINSKININKNPTVELRDLHIPIKPSIRDYIDHDSYIDCSEIRERDYAEIYTAVSENPDLIIGKLDDIDLSEVLDTLKQAKTITLILKKRYGLI
ncbi:MAG: hypothetical protein ACOCXH_02375 [Cyclobacteriaceae bacterium]